MYSIGLDDYLQYGTYGGIGFTSDLLFHETWNWHQFMAGSAVVPSPYEHDTTTTYDEFVDSYRFYTVGPNDVDGGSNATWNRTDSGFIFKVNYVYDTTITNNGGGTTSKEVYHEEEHVVVEVTPYKNATAVKSTQENSRPKEFALFQNYPNPFNPVTIIKYQIPKASHVKLMIFDILGNQVAKLVDEDKSPGSYSVNFDGTALASGVYFYRIQAGNYVLTKKLILLK